MKRPTALLASLFAAGLVVGLLSRPTPAARADDEDDARQGSQAANRNAKLHWPVKSLSIHDATFEQACDQLAQAARANVVIDWERMGAVDRTRRLSVTLQSDDANVASVLRALVALYCPPDAEVSFAPRGGLIYVASGASISAAKVVSYAYDIRDFTERFVAANEPPPDPAPNAGLPLGASGSASAAPAPRPATTAPATRSLGVTHWSRQECIDGLVRLIEETISPNDWRDNGGQSGSIKELGGILLVDATPDAQVQLQRLLNNLRKARDRIDRGLPPTTQPIDLLAP